MLRPDNSEADVIKPLDPNAPRKSWTKAPPKKPRAQVAGQTSVDVLMTPAQAAATTTTTTLDSEVATATPPEAHKFVKAPERDITRPREGYIAFNVRYKVVVASPVKSKESVGKYGRIKPKCITCGIMMTVEHLTQQDLSISVPAPVCKHCRARWADQGRERDAEMAELTKQYKDMSLKAEQEYRERWKICCDCQKVKSIEDVPDCSARECKNFYPRTGAKARRTRYDNTLRRLEAHKGGGSAACGGGVVVQS